jgi:hypothetical protein
MFYPDDCLRLRRQGEACMVFRVLHHNQCFDGACSAAVFTKFHRECIGGADAYEYRGLAHQAGPMSDDIFGTGENAIVDFKYSPSPRLTWWFDHHQSAFLTQEYREHFEAGQRGPLKMRQFFDPDFISCTGFIASIGASRFGWDTAGLEELLYWADIVDGAKYDSAKAAVEMEAPAMQLTMVIENADHPEFIPRIIPLLTEIPLADVLAQPFVQEKVGPLLDKHHAAMELIRSRAELQDGVIFLDLLDKQIEALSKFIPYYYFPQATYTVAVTRSSFRTKISVGTNPWTTIPVDRLENIADICERYGGGGHARVGAISFGPDEEDRARIAATKIAAQLRG